MSIGTGDISVASDPEVTPPYTAPGVALSEWPSEWKRAWSTFHNAEVGDLVRWGSRKQGLEVTDKTKTEDGYITLDVEGPQGGSYTLKERYDEGGHPRYYADDSKALDLHFLDAPDPSETPFTGGMYENLVNNLTRSAVSTKVEEQYDYSTFQAAATAVVTGWADDVDFHRWRGWPYEWDEDTPEYIYRMVIEHSNESPDIPENEAALKREAKDILVRAVAAEGKEQAEARMVDSVEDYSALVDQLASNAMDRSDRKANVTPRDAVRQEVEQFIEAHGPPVFQSILQHSFTDPFEYELYEQEDPDEMAQEMALDVLDADVWAEAREEHQERGTHDPTVRGLKFWEYDQLAEELTEEALREHRLNDNELLFTSAKNAVKQFADSIERHEWPYTFGGVSEGTWADGDVEDIFTSITMHSEVEPQIFNPWARDKERKMAVQVLTEAVHERASIVVDEKELSETPPVPADQYLEDKFGTDMTMNDIRDDTGLTPEDFIRESMKNVDPDELAGWTFVDELVEEGGASVPYVSGPWVLVDYGLVKKKDRMRRIAWFNRDNGSVLVLEGKTTNPPSEGEYGFENFHLGLIEWHIDGDDGPEFLLSDAKLDAAFDWARDFMDADSADVRVIETSDGSYYIQESINEDDISTRSVASGIAPSFNMPGPGFTVDDTLAYGGEAFSRLGQYLTENSRMVAAVRETVVFLFLGEIAHLMARHAPGLNVRPDYHKDYGVGLRATYEFGQQEDLDHYDPDDDSDYYTGQVDANLRITPGAFRFIGDMATPDFIYTAGAKSTTVIGQLGDKVQAPIRQGTGDYFRQPRVAFLGAHLPSTARGRPEGADEYANPRRVTVHGRDTYNQYRLSVGQTLDDIEDDEYSVRSFLDRVSVHGYMTANEYYWQGDDEVRALTGETRSKADALIPVEIQELGWSLERDHILGSSPLVGSPEDVADDNHSAVISHKALLKIWTEFPNTPNTTMLNQAWEFYKTRSEESDEFTLYDAYDRFRMGLVYDTIDQKTRIVAKRMLRKAAAEGALAQVFQQPNDRTYIWGVKDMDAEEVFTQPGTDIGPWMVFSHNNRPGDGRGVTYYYYDDEAGEVLHHVEPDSGNNSHTEPSGIVIDPKRDDSVHTWKLGSWADVENAFTKSFRKDVAAVVESGGEGVSGLNLAIEPYDFDPEAPDTEEDRKWFSKSETERIERIMGDNVRWDDLAGTDLSPLGLFLRGTSMEDALAAGADHWNLSDRFQTRASSVIPNNFAPSRPDIPDFEDWFDKRRGEITKKSRGKATYLREISEEVREKDLREILGIDPGVEADIEDERMMAERTGGEGGDYNLDVFYGSEFGESFDDVAHKFNEQRPYYYEPDDLEVEGPDHDNPRPANPEHVADTANPDVDMHREMEDEDGDGDPEFNW